MIGVPASCRNCFGRSLAIRLPVPAAAMIAVFIKRKETLEAAYRQSALGDWLAVGDTHWTRSTARVAHLPARATVRAVDIAVSAIFRFFPETTKDHLAGCCLQHARDCDIGVLTDQPARIIDNHHRSVVEISDALIVFLPFLEDEYSHRLARQHDRPERVCQLVNVEHAHAAQLGHLVKVKIVRNDYCIELFAQFDQLQVDFAHRREVGLNDLYVERAVVLEAVEHIETSSPALTLGRAGGISHLLQFAKDELAND